MHVTNMILRECNKVNDMNIFGFFHQSMKLVHVSNHFQVILEFMFFSEGNFFQNDVVENKDNDA